MKNRLKRAMSWLLAVFMVLGSITVGDFGGIKAQAGPDNTVKLTVELSDDAKTKIGSYGVDVNGASVIVANPSDSFKSDMQVLDDVNVPLVFQVEKNSSYTVSLDGNYKGEKTVTVTEMAVECVFEAVDLTPDYSINFIDGDDAIVVGNQAEFMVTGENLDAWSKHLTWELVNNPSCVSFDSGNASGGSVTVNALMDTLLPDVASETVTLKVTGAEGTPVSKEISINKQKVGMEITFDPMGSSVNKPIFVNVKIPVTDGYTISLSCSDGTSFDDQSVVDGQVQFQWTPKDGLEHTFTATLAGNSNYTADPATAVYQANKLEQSFEFTDINGNKKVEMTYGDKEQLGAVIKNNTMDGDVAVDTDFELAGIYSYTESGVYTPITENIPVSVRVEEDSSDGVWKVYVKPEAAVDSVFVGVKKTGTDKYLEQIEYLEVKVPKKQLTLEDFSVVTKTYDGTNIFTVNASVNED